MDNLISIMQGRWTFKIFEGMVNDVFSGMIENKWKMTVENSGVK